MTSTGLLNGFRFDGRGGGARVGLEDPVTAGAGLWLDLDYQEEASVAWLRGVAGIDGVICDALIAPSTRPRVEAFGAGFLLVLRGVNLSAGADPEDMVSLRLWVEPGRVISTRIGSLASVDAIVESLDHGAGPADAPGFVVAVIGGLTDRIGTVLGEWEEELATMEDSAADLDKTVDRRDLAECRRRIIGLHRFLHPQARAITDLVALEPGLGDALLSRRAGEIADLLTRYVEDLEAMKGRATVVQEEAASQQVEVLNSRIYLVTLLATLVMPLTFIAGMLGMNVGGIPLTDNGYGFWLTSAVLALMAAALYLILRRFRWL